MSKIRIYLTCEESADDSQRWGGKHITLAGQHYNNNNPMYSSYLRENSVISIVNNGSHYWTAHSGTKFTLRKTKKGYIAFFNSSTLDRIADKLYDLGFRNIKGPDYAPHIKWHITLNGYSEKQAIAYCEMLRNGPRRPKWYLTIATEHPDGTHTWEQLY